MSNLPPRRVKDPKSMTAEELMWEARMLLIDFRSGRTPSEGDEHVCAVIDALKEKKAKDA